jgi:hypothetical protein
MTTTTQVSGLVESRPSALSERQRARVEGLRTARELLAARTLGGTGAVDAIDLVNVAMYIESGEDPWALRPAIGHHATDAEYYQAHKDDDDEWGEPQRPSDAV